MEWNRQLKAIMASAAAMVMLFTGSITVLAAPATLIPMGNSISIQLALSGVFVTNDIPLSKGDGLLKAGDQVAAVDGVSVNSLESLTDAAASLKDDGTVKLSIMRDGREKVFETDGLSFKRSLSFLKDTTEGTGTLTYVDITEKTYGALGHQIIDSSFNSAPDFKTGSIYLSEIEQIKKSSPGHPGYKISSILDQNETLGTIVTNSVVGIFGEWNASYKEVLTKPMEVMQPDELALGPAEILTTIEGTKVESFKINVTDSSADAFKFTLTDERLLKKTGGILQGMSGSPVIQDGKFVGAVTHMFVDQPEKGAGLFLDKMTEQGS
ncbi:SpoIVB peptidase S55 domain-containing protein [Sporosarcina koreensis]|uniref:SpoIVB peptidase S55 domain-containing protein n=1 Tax=Sporosarcina koreensis TaxID=334735 RepID=UPI00058F83DC|nr:SpoIVB peptidase S55 domain-containing protein [Sporosarcina koreensis]